MPIIKHIVNHGNGKAVTLDRSVLQSVGIDPDGDVAVSVGDGVIEIRPISAYPAEQVDLMEFISRLKVSNE